eukprot:gene18790-29014_t
MTGEAKQPRMKVLCMGMPRTGTMSMAQALSVLGYSNVHHGLKMIDNNHQWAQFDEIAAALMEGKDLTQQDFEKIFSEYDACTDMAAPFGLDIIKAYPDAKVVLVERDYGRWNNSIGMVFTTLFGPMSYLSIDCVERLIGSKAGPACRKLMLHWGKTTSSKDLVANLQQSYERHYREIRAGVPADRLLDFKLADGWAPLCEFLGKEVPDAPFPRTNEAKELQRVIRLKIASNVGIAMKLLVPFLVGGIAVGI